MLVAVMPSTFLADEFIHQKHSVLCGYAFPLALSETDGTQVYRLVRAAGIEVGCRIAISAVQLQLTADHYRSVVMTVITAFPDMLGVVEHLLALGTTAVVVGVPLITHRAAYKAFTAVPQVILVAYHTAYDTAAVLPLMLMELSTSVAGDSAIPIMSGISYRMASFTFAAQPFVPKHFTDKSHTINSPDVKVRKPFPSSSVPKNLTLATIVVVFSAPAPATIRQ